MKKVKCLQRQYELLKPLRGPAKNQVVKVLFQGKELQLIHSDFVPKNDFLLDIDVDDGSVLGAGGMKRVFSLDGKAVFLILDQNLTVIQQNIEIEVAISRQMRLIGLQTQELNSVNIGIYDPASLSYLDYPCMFAESFATLSKVNSIEIYDSKNKIRFGSKHKLFNSSADFTKITSISKEIFESILQDIALLLYSGFYYDCDSINIAIMPHKVACTRPVARLFLYDFSSKCRVNRISPEPMTSLSCTGQKFQFKLEYILEGALRYIFEADCLAREGDISTFFKIIYPVIKDDLINNIKTKIAHLIAVRPNLMERITLPIETSPIIFSSRLVTTLDSKKHDFCGFEPNFFARKEKNGLFNN